MIGVWITLTLVFAFLHSEYMGVMAIEVIANGRTVVLNAVIDGNDHCIATPNFSIISHNKLHNIRIGCPDSEVPDDDDKSRAL